MFGLESRPFVSYTLKSTQCIASITSIQDINETLILYTFAQWLIESCAPTACTVLHLYSFVPAIDPVIIVFYLADEVFLYQSRIKDPTFTVAINGFQFPLGSSMIRSFLCGLSSCSIPLACKINLSRSESTL